MLRDQHLYPPNIAETLAALQRGSESRQPSSSRYGLQVCAKMHNDFKAAKRHSAICVFAAVYCRSTFPSCMLIFTPCESRQDARLLPSGHT